MQLKSFNMIHNTIAQKVVEAINKIYGKELDIAGVQLQKTVRDFKGDFTVVVFPLLKISGKSPSDTGNDLGIYLKNELDAVEDFNVVKGFLNVSLKTSYWVSFYHQLLKKKKFGFKQLKHNAKPVVIEYSSPNTNKPLHLGHVRNNLLGWSIAQILEASGERVIKVNLVNDRGVHICKSMLAWQKFSNGETPEESGKKGDKLVGDYYVAFESAYRKEVKLLVEKKGMSIEEAEKNAPMMLEVREMLRAWEENNDAVRALWNKMNQWVYDGFDKTYHRLGIDIDNIYYESDTYLLGKDIVLKGLKKGVLYQKNDGSVWVDLTDKGLDEKLLLRSDGTSLYMTQDIGTALLRHMEYSPQQMLYVVGNEQNYHFTVLCHVLLKLGYIWAKDIIHLSYGMVELPSGKMKSREGTVVDADDLLDEMYIAAKAKTEELGKTDDIEPDNLPKLYEMLGLGALKYFILKVDPKKNMLFDPLESIDFNGHTGPFIQYTYARISSLKRKAAASDLAEGEVPVTYNLHQRELFLLQKLYEWPQILHDAAQTYSPALIANYVYELARDFNQFYHELPILKAESPEQCRFRFGLAQITGTTIYNVMGLLGIDMPERM